MIVCDLFISYIKLNNRLIKWNHNYQNGFLNVIKLKCDLPFSTVRNLWSVGYKSISVAVLFSASTKNLFLLKSQLSNIT